MSFQMIRHSLLSRIQSHLVQTNRLVHRNHPGFKKKPFATAVKLDLPDSYVEEAVYPPVKPKLPPGKWEDDVKPKLAWHYYNEGQKFHSLKTIQERLSVMAYLNVQQTLDDFKTRRTRYYPIYKLSAMPKTPQMVPFTQYITKTVISVDETSSSKNQLDSSISPEMYKQLKTSVIDTILMNTVHRSTQVEETTEIPLPADTYKPAQHDRVKNLNKKVNESDLLLKEILNSITTALGSTESHEHLHTAQYGNNVAIKAYWKRCGYEEQSPRGAVGKDPDTIRYQFEDVATYQVKCDKPLKPLYKLDDEKCTESQIEPFTYNPSSFKIFADHTLPMQVPGHWYGDKREFNFLTVLNTTKTLDFYDSKYSECNGEYDFDALKSMAITTGHAELTAQAYYLGFSMWKDLTYPLMGQYLLSNGQDFSIAKYQLNTLKLWNKGVKDNNTCNITKSERLYELNKDGTDLANFNEDLFINILNVFCNKPCENENELVENYSQLDYTIGGSALRPYLAVNDFEKQLPIRHKLFATSLYELVKYDKPMEYLAYRSEHDPVTYRPQFPRHYDRFTYEYRDIVLDYYPRDYYGFKLVERMLKKSPKQSEKFWDLKDAVFEWANVPAPSTKNIPQYEEIRKIDLPSF